MRLTNGTEKAFQWTFKKAYFGSIPWLHWCNSHNLKWITQVLLLCTLHQKIAAVWTCLLTSTQVWRSWWCYIEWKISETRKSSLLLTGSWCQDMNMKWISVKGTLDFIYSLLCSKFHLLLIKINDVVLVLQDVHMFLAKDGCMVSYECHRREQESSYTSCSLLFSSLWPSWVSETANF